MRLNKYIARSRGVSRRQADDLIAAGEITVNGETAVLGARVEDGDTVKHGQQVLKLRPFKYVVLNKPIGYVSSKRSQDSKPTVYELLPDELKHLQIAGRLDHDSSGLIMLTNDGDFALQLTHPRFQKQKAYELTLDKDLSPSDAAAIQSGVELDDGVSKLELEGSGREWAISMHEGRNRQIRRTFQVLGYNVAKLHRVKMGPYALADLASGQYAEVDKKELE